MGIESGDAAVERWRADRTRLGYGARGEARGAETIRTMLGRRFGSLVVVSYDSLKPRLDNIGGKVYWLCQCDCGKSRPIKAENLLVTLGATRSCGECAPVVPDWTADALRQIALSVEWEGSVGVYETLTPKHILGAYHSPRIVVGVRASTDVLLYRLQELAGVGSVGLANNSQAAAGLRAEPAQWQVTGPPASKLAAALEPYFICKYEQARLVAEYPHGAHHIPVSVEVFEQRRAAARRTAQLNATGPHTAPAEADQRAACWAQGLTEPERMRLLALSLDFEGCISARERHGKYRSASISVSQAQRRVALLTVVQQLAVCGRVSGGAADDTGRLDAMCTWAVHSESEVASLAQQVAPYLLLKRQQAEAVNALLTRTKPPGEMLDLVRKLNRRFERVE
jgi:hypothetical protein